MLACNLFKLCLCKVVWYFLEIWCQRKLRQMKKKHHRAVFFCLEKGHFSALLIYCMPHHLDSSYDMSPVSAYYDVLTIYYHQPFRFDPVLDLLSEKNPVSCLNLSFTAASLSLIKVSRYVRVPVLLYIRKNLNLSVY